MTRINCGIPPASLTSKHLLAEHREIKRIPNVVAKGKYSMQNQPTQFILGTGHVKFFYDKQLYLLNRYKEIYLECKKRGFNVSDFSQCWNNVPKNLMKDYVPTEKDINLVQQRINEKLNKTQL